MKKAPSPQDDTTRLEIVRLSKDEMNLIEYPFAALWRNDNRDVVINHEWDAQHPDTGKALKAMWRVQGDAEMGLPTASDEKVYLVLLELTREANFEQKVFFTCYDLIKRLRWPDNKQSYRMLFEAFQRLKAVTITAQNTFWNPRARSFRNVVFSIIDNVDITQEKKGRKKSDQRELPMSFFKWNDIIFESFQNGYIRSIDLDLILSLKGDITRRLYRYLDKKKHGGRRAFEIELSILCTRHLGMKPSPYPSKLKERIKPAHDELISRGFLREVNYEPMKSRKGEKVCYQFSRQQSTVSKGTLPTEKVSPQGDTFSEQQQSDLTSIQAELHLLTNENTSPKPQEPQLEQSLISAGVSPSVAQELFTTFSLDQITLQLDCLADRDPKNPPATLVTAIRHGWAPPPAYFERLEAAERAQKAKEVAEVQKQAKDAQEAAERARMALQEKEATMLNAMWDKLDTRTQQRVDEQRLHKRLASNEFLRVRLESGKLTTESPDWIQTRFAVLREMLGQASAQE